MLAEQVNFLKVLQLGSLCVNVAPTLCAKAKNRHLSEGCSGPLRQTNLQVCRAGELGPFEMVYRATLIRYEDKTTAGVRGLQLVDTLRSCTFVQLAKVRKKNEKIVTKKNKQDHTEVSYGHFIPWSDRSNQ